MTLIPLAYLAAPLFNQREREFNVHLATLIMPYANVFLPQRDGKLLTNLVADGMSVTIAERLVFSSDLEAMRSADILVAVLDGGHIDEGVAFEIGFANGLGKTCVGLQTDCRRALPTGNNPMISQGVHSVFSTASDLTEWISHWRNEWNDRMSQGESARYRTMLPNYS